jgi:hypothetical protein
MMHTGSAKLRKTAGALEELLQARRELCTIPYASPALRQFSLDEQA